jgi:hypothetical protein
MAKPSPAPTEPDTPPVSSARPGRGRPRLTADDLRRRIAGYCARYGVASRDDGLPPFPAGRRESPQHREWMALYKAHRRLADRGPGEAVARELQEQLAAQKGCCAVCHKPLSPAEARPDARARGAGPAALHARCLQLLELARELGPDALEALRSRL